MLVSELIFLLNKAPKDVPVMVRSYIDSIPETIETVLINSREVIIQL